MSIAVLLSIKPCFADAIFAGDKLFEFRKSALRNGEARKVYVYASAPISKVIGYFYIDELIERPLPDLWKETKNGAGISKKYFEQYFAGKAIGYALKVAQPSLFKTPKYLDAFGISHPPQSFRYVRAI